MRAYNAIRSTRSEKGTVMPGHCKNERRQVPDGDRIQEFARYLLRDPYQENAIKDTIGWGDNRSYKAALYRRPISADAGLESSVFRVEGIAILVGGISMGRGYDVKSLKMARGPLYECPDRNDTDSPASGLTSSRSPVNS